MLSGSSGRFLAMIYPDILIFSSILLTTSVQQTSHLSFHLWYSRQLTRDLKGSFFSMSSNIKDNESISRSMLFILPRTYTTIHEERGIRAYYRSSQTSGRTPYNSRFLHLGSALGSKQGENW